MDKNEYCDMFSKLHTSVDEEELITSKKRRGKPRIAAIVLAAVLIASLAAGAAAVYHRSVRDLVLKSNAAPVTGDVTLNTEETDVIAASVSYDPLPENTDMISLQGYAGSPEYQAVLEWSEFGHDYDRDGEKLRAVGNNPTKWDEKYGFNGYMVYTQEMADKIEEIAERYGLALHSGGIVSHSIYHR